MVVMTTEEDFVWVINKFKSIVNPFLKKTADADELKLFWERIYEDYPRPFSKPIATTVNVIKDDTPPEQLGNVMNNLMFDFIVKSDSQKMEMDEATQILRNNMATKNGIIGKFHVSTALPAWYITCGEWLLSNSIITPPKAKKRKSITPSEVYHWSNIFKGGGPEGDIFIYYFTDGARVLAPLKRRKVGMSASRRAKKSSPVVMIEQSRIYPELLQYTTTPLLNWKQFPSQFIGK
jgi:hypothetical protein